MQPATLDLSKCSPGNVQNISGTLQCTPGSGLCASQVCTVPPGTYQQYCIDPSVSGTVLLTSCMTTPGMLNTYWLDLHTCGMGDIYLDENYQLVCQPGNDLC